MSWPPLPENFDDGMRLFNARIRLGFFVLMGLGLVLATALLWFDKLDSGDWALVCSVLFGSDRIGTAIGSRA